MNLDLLQQLLPVYVAYVIATASPGPSNMAIMGVAMSRGRAPAVALALGVVTGSMCWALLAATGISAILTAYAEALVVLKIAGGLYLLYLAFKAARSALSAQAPESRGNGLPASKGALYRRGMLLHLTNPKAVLGWMAIMTLGLRPDSPAHTLHAIIGGCVLLGITVFAGYALVFSTGPMIRIYQRARRWIEGTLALVFGVAGFRLLLWRN
ncbi:amino acid transporter [Pannonibacter phragmitetus]|uniref:Amino acid transporter n=1 Tax=Pannonibacter phragmitetus TaxID=121719 RepID=A0A0L0J7C9_9HYPH|nr:LysE family translocator [Pannonibacter phragmitetus]ALV29486.1 amino acid transporter [Pannonibacter phragmitetus]KND21285.1 amino acid transporter [Pannonibacter phragmitetus]